MTSMIFCNRSAATAQSEEGDATIYFQASSIGHISPLAAIVNGPTAGFVPVRPGYICSFVHLKVSR